DVAHARRVVALDHRLTDPGTLLGRESNVAASAGLCALTFTVAALRRALLPGHLFALLALLLALAFTLTRGLALALFALARRLALPLPPRLLALALSFTLRPVLAPFALPSTLAPRCAPSR